LGDGVDEVDYLTIIVENRGSKVEFPGETIVAMFNPNKLTLSRSTVAISKLQNATPPRCRYWRHPATLGRSTSHLRYAGARGKKRA
jgi:hypothetical protein